MENLNDSDLLDNVTALPEKQASAHQSTALACGPSAVYWVRSASAH